MFLLSASLVGVLLMIEQFRASKVTFDPVVPAGAVEETNTNVEHGIDARVVDDREVKKGNR